MNNSYSKWKKKLLAAALCASIALGGAAALTLPLGNVDYVFAEAEIKEKYVVGDDLQFPELTIEHGGTQYATETVLHYPDGSVKKCSAVRFNAAGEYVIEYRATVAGKLLRKTYDVKVEDTVYSVNSSSKVQYKTDDSQYNTGHSGVWVDLSNGGEWTYNKAIDLTELDKREEAIKLFVLPKVNGQRDLTDIVITFTDAYDSNNRVILQVNCPHWAARQSESAWQDSSAMFFVGTSETSMYGFRYDPASGGAYMKSDTWYRYGYETYFTFNGNPGGGNTAVGKAQLSIGFDLDTGCVYGPDNGYSETLVGVEEPQFMADLTDDMVYPEAWKGFTTGEVYVTVKGAGYLNSSAEIMITKLGREDLSSAYYCGATKPGIEVDTDGYAENELPVAEVGKEYTLFKATGRDYHNGTYSIVPRVFYQYDYETTWEVSVSNGKFTPDRAGTYSLVWTVTDGFGQSVEKRLDVKAVDELGELSATIGDHAEAVKTGETVKLAPLTITGGSGRYDVQTSVRKDKTSFVIEDGTFKPERSGEWTVNYFIKDYLGNKITCSYTFTASHNATPVAENDPVLPAYFIEGKTYVLPECVFGDYSTDDPQTIDYTITVTDGNGTSTLGANREYTVKADVNGEVKVQYAAAIGSEKLELPVKTVKVIDVEGEEEGSVDLCKYFVTEGLDLSLTRDGVLLGGETDGAFSFINSVVANKFSLKFKIEPTQNNFTLLEFYIQDSENPAQKVKVSLSKLSSGTINVLVNGVKVTGSIATTWKNGAIATLAYADGVLSINGSEIRATLKTYENGEAFNGFTSGKVYFGGAIKNVGAESAILITKINNQTLGSSITSDNIAPEIAIKGNYTMVNDFGAVVKILDVYAADVLDSLVNVTVTVKNPSGRNMTATDGTLLNAVALGDYEITLSEFGVYTILYLGSDSSGKTVRLPVSVGVYDLEKPTITVSGSVPTEAKVGNKVKVPSATVTDNDSENLTCYVYVVAPNGTNKVWNANMTYNTAGVWKINYVAYDKTGNMQLLTYKVTVR